MRYCIARLIPVPMKDIKRSMYCVQACPAPRRHCALSWPSLPGSTGPTGPAGGTGATGSFSGALTESLLPSTPALSLGSAENPFQELFLAASGAMHVGPVTLTSSSLPRDAARAPTGPVLIVEGIQEVDALTLSSSGDDQPISFERAGSDTAKVSASLLLEGNLSFGVPGDPVPPVSITNERGTLNLPAGTLLAGAPLSVTSTGATGPTGPSGGGATGPTGPGVKTTFVKASSAIVTIPDPAIEGEEYIGVNAGSSFKDQVQPWPPPAELGFRPFCVVAFQNVLAWCGEGFIKGTDPTSGAIMFSIAVTGSVYAAYVEPITQRLYFGGSFSQVAGPFDEYGNIGYLDAQFAPYVVPNINSSNGRGLPGTVIYAIIGAFWDSSTSVCFAGSPSASFQATNVYNYVDDQWKGSPVDSIQGTVYACYYNAPNAFFGGSFAEADGAPAQNFVRCDTSTGTVSYSPSFNGKVSAIASDKKSYYFGGSFTQVNGQAVAYVAQCPMDFSAAKQYLALTQPVASVYCDSKGVWLGSADFIVYGGTTYTTSVFSQGIGIQYNGAFLGDYTKNVYVTNQSSSPGQKRGAYIIVPPITSVTFQATTAGIIGPGSSSVKCGALGASFTLKASLSPSPPCWYVTALVGATLSSSATGVITGLVGAIAGLSQAPAAATKEAFQNST